MKRRKWLIFVVVGIVGVLAAVIEYGTRSSWSRVQSRARAAGLALTADEMRDAPPKLTENAANDYRRAISEIKALPPFDRTLLNVYDSSSRRADPKSSFGYSGFKTVPTWGQVESSLKVWKPVFDHIERGTAKPHLDWDRKWELGIYVGMPEYADLKMTAKAMAIDARAAIKRGDHAQGLKRLRQVRRIAEQVEEEASLIALLVSLSIRTAVALEAMTLTETYRSNATLVAQLRDFFGEESLPKADQALRGEAFFAICTLEEAARHPALLTGDHGRGDPPITDISSFPAQLLRLGSYRSSVKCRVIERITTAKLALVKSGADWKRAEETFKDLDADLGADESWIGSLGRRATPIFSQTGNTIGKLEARKRLGVMLTYLADSYRQNGRWPNTVLEKGKWSTDPFSGKPFHYRRTKEGFVLHSVGPDRKDGGGDLSRSSRDVSIGQYQGHFVIGR